MNNEEIITNNSEETKEIGKSFAKNLKGGEFIALYGKLGAGKTTFVQGMALGLGIKKRIISPTFIIIRSYKIKSKSLYHVDLYRLENENGIEGLGFEEIVGNPENILVVEWAEKMGNLLPQKRTDIYFDYLNETQRKISFIKHE